MVRPRSKIASLAGVLCAMAFTAAPEPVVLAGPTAVARGPLPVVPAVRSFTPRAGAAWKPGTSTRVVAARGGTLEDEARLLAGELHVPYADGPARAGDVSLSLDRVNANPEAYELTAGSGGITVRGRTDAGVFYGTRTLLQVLRADGRFPAGAVRDEPDRAQRGLTVDIARKNFSRGWIEDRIRELGDLKLNQLHLHFSDDQGFRIESSSHPEIVSAQHLSKADLRAITALAERRHVTVVPEIDTPGHLGSVFAAHPELQLRDASGAPAHGAIDISDPRAARITDDLLREFAPLFPGPYWHLGGDEYHAAIVPAPEAAYPRLAALARRRYGPGATVADAETGWLNDRAALLRSYGKIPKLWNDGFHGSALARPDAADEIEYWSGKRLRGRRPEEYLKEGRRLVNLNDEYLYYVLGGPKSFPYPTGQRIYEKWTPAVVYGTAAVAAGLSGPDRILGARLAVWCDDADAQTEGQIAAGIRMPLHALSQKLWDPRRPALSWKEFTALAARVG
jgi:hexosaminidase